MSYIVRNLLPVALLFGGSAQAQTEVKPYFLVIVDNSGSMEDATGEGLNSCGQPQTRFNDAKCVVQKIINSYGDVTFGLARFKQTTSGSCPCNESHLVCGTSCNESTGAGCPSAGDDADQGQILVPIEEDNQWKILEWVDFTCGSCGKTAGMGPELVSGTWTPIGGAIRGARRYYRGLDPTFPTSPIGTDPYKTCRPYYVILLTDGIETCASHTSSRAAVTDLRTTTVDGTTYDIRTFVIGFGIIAGDTYIETYAMRGGTDAPGPLRAFYATDETTLSIAFNQIISGSLLTEICDGADNDCDGLVDEGFPVGASCDGPDEDVCPEGELVCSPAGDGTMCDDLTSSSEEVCNGLDDDCDGLVDEPPADCGGCVPQPEICNNVDDDCDGSRDEGLTRPCGTDVGACTPGVEICTAGVWGACSGVAPQPESCDGLDNDCDGIVDGMAQACGHPAVGQCLPGTSVCISGTWGPCTGAIGPGTEGCDGIDNDCDGMTDEGNPGGGAPCGTACGAGMTVCMGGMLVCVGSGEDFEEVCNGIDDDCDGLVDEDLPDMGPCGTPGTACEGVRRCVGGSYQCDGAIPEPESCDCVDNDCDGVADDPDPGPLCPGAAVCLGEPYCQCARACAGTEFPCPSGYVCRDGYCVVDLCKGVNCKAGEVCVDAQCLPLCAEALVTCEEPLICRPTDGACVEDNCNGFPERCAKSEFCIAGSCVPNKCYEKSCPDQHEYCVGGECLRSCTGIRCPSGKSCRLGGCEDDPCADVHCSPSQVCDPASGTCVKNGCLDRVCPPGTACQPVTGECGPDLCLGVVCPAENEVCEQGTCAVPPPAVDAGLFHYVTAAGGGCSCRVGPGAGSALPAGVALALAMLLILARRRAR